MSNNRNRSNSGCCVQRQQQRRRSTSVSAATATATATATAAAFACLLALVLLHWAAGAAAQSTCAPLPPLSVCNHASRSVDEVEVVIAHLAAMVLQTPPVPPTATPSSDTATSKEETADVETWLDVNVGPGGLSGKPSMGGRQHRPAPSADFIANFAAVLEERRANVSAHEKDTGEDPSPSHQRAEGGVVTSLIRALLKPLQTDIATLCPQHTSTEAEPVASRASLDIESELGARGSRAFTQTPRREDVKEARDTASFGGHQPMGSRSSEDAGLRELHSRVRRAANDSANATLASFECTLSMMIEIAGAEGFSPPQGATLFEQACQSVSDARSQLLLHVDAADQLSQPLLDGFNEGFQRHRFRYVSLMTALDRDWVEPLVRVLTDLQWPESIENLALSSPDAVAAVDGQLPMEAFDRFSSLTSLSISLGGLTALQPGTFSHFTSINQISIFGTRLSCLPADLFGSNLRNLTLILEAIPLASLSDGLLSDATLSSLVLSDLDELTGVPGDLLGDQPLLTSISVTSTALTMLPPTLFDGCPGLQRVDFSGNNLGSLPDGLFSSTIGLTSVSFTFNLLQRFPPQLFIGLSNLIEVDFGSNQLTHLPTGDIFSDCPGLRHVDFYVNSITELPAGLFSTQEALEYVDFGRNRLKSVPRNLFEKAQPKLTTLYFEENELSTLPSRVFEKTPSLHTLWLQSNQLRELPAGIFANVPALIDLTLDSNQLRELPAGIFANLPALTFLALDSNSIRFIDEGTFAMTTSLEVLVLNHNMLTSIAPSAFQALTNLQQLLLSNNPQLTVSAELFAPIQALRSLELYGVTVEGEINEVFEAKRGSWNLTTLKLGWEGLDEATLPITTACNLLRRNAEFLQLSPSSYKNVELCRGRNISVVVLSNNPKLVSVEAYRHVSLDLSNCSSLVSLSQRAGSAPIPIVDVSNTSLSYSRDFCTRLGSQLFTARHMVNPAMLEPVRILRQCFSEGIAFDFSDNKQEFSNVTLLREATPGRTVLGARDASFSDDFYVFRIDNQSVLFHESVPVFIVDGVSISCQPVFTRAEIVPSGDRNTPTPLRRVTFTTNCSCATGFEENGDFCHEERKPRPYGLFVGLPIAAVVGVFAIQFAARWYKRKQKERYMLLEENELQERLLTKATEDVAALKQGWRISLDEISLVTKVDEGAFGAVWKGDWEGVMVAVKFLKFASVGMIDQFALDDIGKEVDFLQRTRHTNLVRFFGTGTDTYGAPFLVLEFVDLGSLKHLLHEKGLDAAIKTAKRQGQASTSSLSDSDWVEDEEGDVDEDTLFTSTSSSPFSSSSSRVASPASLKLCLVRDIVDGMAFLHSLNVMHRDLKSGNVLVNKRLVAKITDFGSMSGKLSHLQQQQQPAGDLEGDGISETDLQYSRANLGSTVGLTMTKGVGTPLYMAPEVLDPKTRKLSFKADVFSFGVLMWEICECRTPDLIEQELGDTGFNGFVLQTLFRLYSEDRHLNFSAIADEPDHPSAQSCPSWYEALSLACMSFSPSERPAFDEIKQKMQANSQKALSQA